MVKALLFKGDKKPKKRKRAAAEDEDGAPTSKALTTTTTSTAADGSTNDDDDSWVTADLPTDITGPVIIVLPTDTASCLSCDSHGKVFSILVENSVDNDPTTSEPHDVRQVWVANRIAGTESYSFKAHHGRYLGSDKFGILGANREAISPEEQFNIIPVADNPGTFALQTQRDTFVVAEEKKGGAVVDVRGDGEGIDFKSTLRIRMQARFKPKLKVAKEERAKEKISRKELEVMAGRKLEDDEVKRLKRARREGNFHEMMLDVKVKGKHDKFA
jgi:protein FRG1